MKILIFLKLIVTRYVVHTTKKVSFAFLELVLFLVHFFFFQLFCLFFRFPLQFYCGSFSCFPHQEFVSFLFFLYFFLFLFLSRQFLLFLCFFFLISPYPFLVLFFRGFLLFLCFIFSYWVQSRL